MERKFEVTLEVNEEITATELQDVLFNWLSEQGYGPNEVEVK